MGLCYLFSTLAEGLDFKSADRHCGIVLLVFCLLSDIVGDGKAAEGSLDGQYFVGSSSEDVRRRAARPILVLLFSLREYPLRYFWTDSYFSNHYQDMIAVVCDCIVQIGYHSISCLRYLAKHPLHTRLLSRSTYRWAELPGAGLRNARLECL